jgi:hypothetical protein
MQTLPTFLIVDLLGPVIFHLMLCLLRLTYQAGLLPFAPTFPDHFPQQLDGSKHQPNTDIHGSQFTAFISFITMLLVNEMLSITWFEGVETVVASPMAVSRTCL